LWEVPDKDLLALGDVGLVPLLPLTKSRQPVPTLVQQSKERIEGQAPTAERDSLLTITAIMAAMRAGHVEQWLSILGGKMVVEHSPLYQMWMAEKERETKQADIVSFLTARFKTVPEEVAAYVRTVTDLNKLEEGIKLAAKCRSVNAFHKQFPKV
jgi:hypothetical protein